MIVKSKDAKQRRFRGVSFDLLAVGPKSMVTRMNYTADSIVPFHQHPNEQSGYVISGKIRFKSADIDEILNWEDPGPGGFYDNLGVEGKQPHLVRQMQGKDDPGFVHSPIEYNFWDPDSWYRQSMLVCAITRYDTPLLMRYEGLDPAARYQLKILYTGPFDP